MRILHIISSLNPSGGGPQEGLRQICAAMRDTAYASEVATLDSPHSPWLGDFPATVHALGPAWSRYLYSPHMRPWLRAHARHYDALIVHGLWQYHSFATWAALRHHPTPYFIFPHGMLDPWFKRTYPIKHLKKWLYWPWAEYRVLRDAEGVLFTCEDEKLLARQSFGLYGCREVVAGYGISTPSGDPQMQQEVFLRQYPTLRGKKIILYLGRIHPKKGCDLLIDAFASVAERDKSLQLVMAGPDHVDWGAALRARSQKLGIAERITWTGMLMADSKWGALHAADAFILPSHQENFGVAVVEALACKLPVLISNKVNIWREIEADGVGLVAEDTLPGTLSLLEAWLSMPAEKKREMRLKTWGSFANRFHISQTATRLLELVEPCRRLKRHEHTANGIYRSPER